MIISASDVEVGHRIRNDLDIIIIDNVVELDAHGVVLCGYSEDNGEDFEQLFDPSWEVIVVKNDY